jgi:hypothetical protein
MVFIATITLIMSISHYIKEIGRGTKGARSLSRTQACDLMGQVLDGKVSDLELGGFCIAMRFKGESAEELAGFLDATQQRLPVWPQAHKARPVVVIPSYNGSRKLANLTPLLAGLLAQKGLPVLVHGSHTEDKRLGTAEVWRQLGWTAIERPIALEPGDKVWMQTVTCWRRWIGCCRFAARWACATPRTASSNCWTLSRQQHRAVRAGAGQLYPPGLCPAHAPDPGPACDQCAAGARHGRRGRGRLTANP